ncbi:sensor histidine kinase [Neptuniibacter sp. CAU 1671]|uniref:HAMP domain-containing sensor histidine kinase n=1 Tax=Neptuniibacter sp. CAU 1671 TaxID=3032593 RepID=UPI0023DC89B7|nr:sensor histidine kinase [Neptuniibacter sp. CAU 1671]MDF2181221.1 sensor histidine kinase [Neptuniibacter sp. CAU 1671]
MPVLRLNLLLMMLVILSGIIALFFSAAFILQQADQASRDRTARSAVVAQQQLQLQLYRIDNQFEFLKHFPDFHLWQKSVNHAGLCVTYRNREGDVLRSLCLGDVTEENWPQWFQSLYLKLFTPAQPVQLDVTYKEQLQGRIEVSSSEMVEIGRAWQTLTNLMELVSLIVLTLCIILYLMMHWILRPVRITQQCLQRMVQEDLSLRVPEFKIAEWQETGVAINRLAESLQSTLVERQALALKLVNVQEEERRFLCRELHDELGQSLAGLSAVASAMAEDARHSYPQLQEPANQITRIAKHMRDLVKGLLLRLRPADLEQLGLAESLRGLTNEWNNKHQAIRWSLFLQGDVDGLPASVSVNLLRIVQECLTNISRHSGATKAEVELVCSDKAPLILVIRDNGQGLSSAFVESPGHGLLGIRERVSALGGTLAMTSLPEGGLRVVIEIPVVVLGDSA